MSKNPIIAKKIKVYTNGDKFSVGKLFYIHPKTTRTFVAFLEYLTEVLDPVFGAVRHLRTADGKEEIKTLDSLESGESYVAYGQKFQSFGYTEIKPLTAATSNSNVNYLSPREIPPRRVIASGRAKKIVRKPVAIHVYCNGDPLLPAKQILLKPWVHRTWEAVLEEISNKISLRTGAIRKLIDLDGFKEINFGADLRDGGYYVACGRERFKNCEYGMSLFTLPPKHQMNRRYPTLPPIDSSQKTNYAKSTASAPTLGEKDKFQADAQATTQPQQPQSRAWEDEAGTTPVEQQRANDNTSSLYTPAPSQKQLSPVAQSPIQTSRRETPQNDNDGHHSKPQSRAESNTASPQKDTEAKDNLPNTERSDNVSPVANREAEKIISLGSRPASQSNNNNDNTRDSQNPSPVESTKLETPRLEKQDVTEENQVFGTQETQNESHNADTSRSEEMNTEQQKIETPQPEGESDQKTETPQPEGENDQKTETPRPETENSQPNDRTNQQNEAELIQDQTNEADKKETTVTTPPPEDKEGEENGTKQPDNGAAEPDNGTAEPDISAVAEETADDKPQSKDNGQELPNGNTGDHDENTKDSAREDAITNQNSKDDPNNNQTEDTTNKISQEQQGEKTTPVNGTTSPEGPNPGSTHEQ